LTSIVLTVIGLLGLLGLGVGGRHLYLRLDRPRGFECSLRVVRGEIPGLSTKFRAGYAGPEMRNLFWRRVSWPGAGVRFPIESVRIDQLRHPRGGERLAVPSTFSVIPVEVNEDVTLELALPSRRVKRLVGLLRDPGPHP
jgi:hypothetical protein